MSRPVRRPGLLVLVLVCPLACGPGKSDTTASTSTGGTTDAGTTDAGQSVTSNGAASTSTTTTGDPTTTAISTTDPSTTGTSDDSGQGFITPPDVGCPGASERSKQCDPWAQDCPAGEKCSPSSGGCDGLTRTICTEVSPDPVGLGGACVVEVEPLSGKDDCDLGLLCTFVDPDSLVGTCVSLCHGSPDAPDCSHVPGTSCMLIDDIFIFGGLCLPTCDPLSMTCPPGQTCHPNLSNPEDFVCVPDSSGDAGAAFDPCEDTACDPGLACVAPTFAAECAPDTNCCTPFCDLDAPACPGVGQVCLPYFEADPIPPGMEDVGLCGLM